MTARPAVTLTPVSDRAAGQRALIVVPAWNEADNITATVAEIHAAVPEIDVLVVDDGSGDQTAVLARRAGAQVLELAYNLGVGGAMRAGFRYAVRHGYTAVVQIDADGQHDPAEVPAMLAALESADIVIGARFAGQDGYRVRGPRKWAMGMLARAVSRLARTRITDATSGYRATGPRALPVFAEHYPAEYLGDTIESLVIAVRVGCRITQVPARMRPRRNGEPSHRPVKSSIYLLRAVFALLLALIRKWDTPRRLAPGDEVVPA
jgi:glycosyltransferase involved in cell wall biosynthesis